MQFEKLTTGIEAAAVREHGRRILRVSVPATIVLVLVLAGVALSEVNGVLRGMHGNGQPGYGAQDVVDLFHPWATEDRADRVVASWRGYIETAGPSERPGPDTMVSYFVWIDSLGFALFYAIGAAFLLTRFTSRKGTETDRRRARLARTALWGVPAAFVFDIAENMLVRRTATDGLADGDVGQTTAYAVWALNAAKTLAIVWFVLPLIALVVAALRDAFRRRDEIDASLPGALTLRTVTRRLRIHILLVIVLGALLLGHEQIPDLVRRWSPLQGLATVAFATAFALTVWLAARWLVRSSRESELFTAGRPWLSYAVPVAILVGGVLLAVVGAGWGLIIPGVLLSLVAFLSFLSRVPAKPPPDDGSEPTPAPPRAKEPAEQDESSEEGSIGNRASRILAAAILVLLGIGVFHASFAQAILYGKFRWEVLIPFAVFACAFLLGIYLQLRLQPRRLVALFATEPLVLGFAALALYVLLTQPPRDDTEPWLQVVLGVLLAFAGWWLYHRLASIPALSTRTYRIAGGILVVGSLVLAVVVIARPYEVASRLGGIAMLASFLALLALVGALVVRVNDGVPAPPSLAALEIKHVPLLTLLLVWFVLASVLDKGGYHDIRADLDSSARSVTFEQAWSCWLQRNGLDAADFARCPKPIRATTATPAGAVPLILVASTGGGTRAAYWTAAVLDCAFETNDPQCDVSTRAPGSFERSDRLFAMSGISGGSLGLAGYTALLAEREEDGTASDPEWYERRLSGDALSPSVAWWLYVESVQSLLRFTGTRDRAAVLEQGWESDWQNGGGDALERGLFETWWRRSHTPLLLLNGTNVTDGCRFSVSVLNASIEAGETESERIEQCRSSRAFDEDASGPVAPDSALAATRELADYACPDSGDIRLSTAALLSARFPFVSPSGRIASCNDDSIVSYVVDGGYLDTSGASPLVELMKRLEPLIDRFNQATTTRCVVPFLIQVDNGPPAGAQEGTRRPLEVNVPLVTLFQTRIARAANARNAAALEFTTEYPDAVLRTPGGDELLGDRYAHFFNVDAPGPRPPLGWVMSSFSRDELRADRFRGPNPDAFAEVRSWLGDDPARRVACN
ncbi:MAG: hypothetical protein ACRDPX_05690 [Gaiellaceae bacterium]